MPHSCPLVSVGNQCQESPWILESVNAQIPNVYWCSKRQASAVKDGTRIPASCICVLVSLSTPAFSLMHALGSNTGDGSGSLALSTYVADPNGTEFLDLTRSSHSYCTHLDQQTEDKMKIKENLLEPALWHRESGCHLWHQHPTRVSFWVLVVPPQI